MTITLLIAAYVIATGFFGLVILARTRRTLAIAAVAAAAAILLITMSLPWFVSELVGSGPPMSVTAVLFIFFPPAVYIASASTLLGTGARAIALGRRQRGSKTPAAPSFAGFLVLNLAFFGIFVAFPTFVQRPPSEACLGATFGVEIDGEVLSVPAAPEVTIRRFVTSDYAIWPLDSHAVLRRLCERTSDGAGNLLASSITIRIYELDGFTRRERRYCETPDLSSWSRAICAQEGQRPENWPHHIILAGGDSKREIGFPLEWRRGPEAELEAYLNNRGPPSTVPEVGPFQVYQFGYISFWVSDDPAFVLPDGRRFVAQCHAGCTVVFDKTPTIRAAYEFYHSGLDDTQMLERLEVSRAAALEIIDSIVSAEP